MFVLLNGSFGIGKTTVADLLSRQIPGASIYDPERVGFILRRLPPWMLGRRHQPDDYQDLAVWRYLVADGIRRRHKRFPIVIVPMTFTHLEYLDALRGALAHSAPILTICLVAPLETIGTRLSERARREGNEVGAWVIRRSQECVTAHNNPAFGIPIDATRTPLEIAAVIRDIIFANSN